jgi:predicted ATPase/DNA-binding SARP family transcriptional activator/tetratricopeptide (TPR) repeat protein
VRVVGLLGPVELRVDGRPVALSGAPQRVVLARLALVGRRVVPIGELIEALWGDDPPGNAVGNLHSYVSKLRRHIAIHREPGGYRLSDEATDIGRAERLVAAGQPAEALNLWRGEALADVADRLAFAPEVARLAEWRRHLREEWFDQRLAAGEAAQALPDIEAHATAEPMRERACLLHMRALHHTGRTAEALGAGRAYRERVVDGHGVDPSPALDELQRRILAEDPLLRPGTPRRRADRFFGRVDELAALRTALAGGRMTTLTGPGGVGKTRLMTEALTGDELVVELAERSAPGDVAATVAGALGLRAAPRGGVAAVADRLGSGPALLVLDNCEHLLDAVRELVGEILVRCPRVRILATSRQPLGVPGERVLRLGPLPPEDQVALFCDRASLLRAEFPHDARSRALAAEVCGLVDGLPLAVELAARREAVFGLAHLRDRLGAGLQVLDPIRGGDRGTAVSATVEWSYRLLDEEAQRLLDSLAVCRGGFDLSILAYLSADARVLAELVDASLVICDVDRDPPRYRLLETVRHVALTHGRADRDAHARWMLDFITDLLRRQRVRNPDTTPALRRERGNLQEALTWLEGREEGARLAAWTAVAGSDAPDPGLTAQLLRFTPVRVETETDALCALAAGTAEWLDGRLGEANRLLTAAIDRLPEGHPLTGAALLLRISNSMFVGRADLVRADAQRLRENREAPAWTRSTGLCCAALMDAYGGDAAAGLRRLDAYGKELNADRLDGFVPFTRGELLAGTDPEAALSCYDESLRRTARAGLEYTANIARVARAAVLIRLGRHDEAAEACRRTIVLVRAAGMTAQLWTALRLTAELLADRGDREAAAVLVAAADDDPYAPVVMGPDVGRLALLRTGVPAPRPEDIVEYALARLKRQGASKPAASGEAHRPEHD